MAKTAAKVTGRGRGVAKPPAVSETSSPRFQIWYELAAFAAAYFFIDFVLCPGTRFIATPVHHDDFSNLGHATYMWYAWRPVSYTILLTLSQLGISAYYSALHALIVLYAFLSMYVLRRLLDVRSAPVSVLLLMAAAMLGYEYTVEYSKYTGLITNLLSGVFAVCAMSLMIAKAGATPQLTIVFAVWIFAALSFWSKEDFLLPVLVLGAYLALGSRADLRRGWFVMLAGLVVEAALLFLYNRHVQSVFTESTSGSYKPDFSLLSILRTAVTYVLITPGAKMAALLAASALAWNSFAAHPIPWRRLLAFLAITAAIAVPYLCLPNHLFPYYALNWTVWEVGGSLLALWKFWPGKRGGSAVAVLAVAFLLVTQPGRAVIGHWYSERAEVNRNILKSLAVHRDKLEPYPAIAVEGAPTFGPWFGNGGDFLKNRLGMDHVWLVRVPKDGDYWTRSWGLLGTDIAGDIKTVATQTEPVSPDMPLVKISAEGNVTVDYPAR